MHRRIISAIVKISILLSSPRRRGSRVRSANKKNWIPAFAGMTVCFVFFFASPALATPAHGIAQYGVLKYKSGFDHFDYVNPDAPKGGTIKLAAHATFDSMNPFILRGLAAPGVSNFVYQSLMTQSYDEPQSYYGLVAESVDLAADKSSAIFTLNKNARWNDGKPITADDVVFSFNILREKGHPSYRMLLKPITAEAVDARHVRVHFADTKRRELPIIAASMPVLPKHYFCDSPPPPQSLSSPRRWGSKAATDNVPELPKIPASAGMTDNNNCVAFEKTTLAPPLGSGPYQISHVDPGRSITYARVKDYWAANLPTQKGLNNFDTIQIDVYRDDVVATEGIKSHQFDYYEEFIARNFATSYDIPAVADGRLIKARIPHKIPRGMQGFLFNTRDPKFADVRVRQAIGLTLDFEWMNAKLFYGAYERNSSFFNNTEFEAKGLPGKDELKLLAPYKKDLPPEVFTASYHVPTTDGTGFARGNLICAQGLLNDAGWVMKNGVRVNEKTGEPLTVEFLMTQRTFERVVAIMRHNLKKLGIESTFRYVDASQYQKRVDDRKFEVISIWWNQGLFYPGKEQYLFWHSSQADVPGSQNLAGVKNKAIDMLTDKIIRAQNLAELTPAARALDRVLLQEHYVIPHWNLSAWRVLYWNQFGRPKITPAYNIGLDSWWALAAPDANEKGAEK